MADKEQGKIYKGWWIVLTALILMALIFAPIMNLAGLFVKPISEDFNISRTVVTLQMAISTFSIMIASALSGKIFEKFPIKRVMTVAAILVAAAFLGYSFSPNIYLIYFFAIILGFSSAFLTSIPISILINNWFGPKIRGRAMGIALIGSGIGAMVLTPFIGYINTTFGWRNSYRIFALGILVIVLPLILKNVVASPTELGIKRLGDEDSEEGVAIKVEGLTTKEALKTSAFYIMALAILLYSLVSVVFNAIGAPYFTDIGFTPVQAGTFISIASASLIVGKIVLGAICDRIGAFNGALIASLTMALGVFLIVLTNNNPRLVFPAMLVFGLGNALPTVTLPLLVAEMFGNREYGSIVGMMNIAAALGATLAPVMGSSFYDLSGSYITSWYAVLVLMATMFILTYLGKAQAKKLA